MNMLIRRRAAPYFRRLLIIFGSSVIAYWPLWESSGTTANDISGNGYNGTHIGDTLGQPGIGDGRTCPYFDGINDLVNLYSAGLAGAFNGSEGTAMFWMKVFDSSFWTDGAGHRMFFLLGNGENYVDIIKPTAHNTINWEYRAGNVYKAKVSTTYALTSWLHLAITWDHDGDQMIAYANGAQVSTAATGLGDWTGTLAANNCNLGAYGVSSPTSPCNAWFAQCVILNKPATAAEIAMAAYV